MFVNEQIRRCAVFLYGDFDCGENQPCKESLGTAFFVSKSLDDSDLNILSRAYYPNGHICYIVTARHIITECESEYIYIRLNKNKLYFEPDEKKYEDIITRKDEWMSHPKENTTDVMVYRFKRPSKDFDITAIPFAGLTTKIYLAQNDIGSGDEIFYVGLFTGHEGMERAEPIIRFGNISLMLPFEQVKVYLNKSDEKPTPIEAYLVEARSWDGFSGSPVLFYWPSIGRGQQYTEAALRFRFELPLLLGLIFGQYKRDISVGADESFINAGIAIVIPADKIREVIMQTKFSDERKLMLERPDQTKKKGQA